jgi:hypothetical protein
MSITPVGGWVNPPQSSEESHSSASPSGSCPKCQSSDWKSASLAYSEGLSVTSSHTRGTVVGVGRVGIRNGKSAIGGGVYRGRTSGVQQTVLSKLAAPPQRRMGFVVFLAIVFIILGLAAFANLTSGQYLVRACFINRYGLKQETSA